MKNSLKEIKKLKNNVLPSSADVIDQYCHLKKELIDTDVKFSKNPDLRDVKDKRRSDIA